MPHAKPKAPPGWRIADLPEDSPLRGGTVGGDRERAYQRDLMRSRRQQERSITIDASRIDPARRAACANDPVLFCTTYFPDVFYHPFTDDQRAMVAAITERIHYGGYQALAAERGGGKSTITKIVGGVWAVVYGYIDWLVLLNPSGRMAMDTLKDIKSFYEFNDLLREDFPEICDPIRALEGAPQRGGFQMVDGQRTRLAWGTEEIVLPTVAGSAAAGAIITARGIDAAIRGLVRGAKRPRLVLVDDIETRESANSYTQTASRRETLQKDVIGLAGPGRQIAIALLCTVINRKCLAWEYTDRKLRPEWNGIRQQWIKVWPTDADAWERYIAQRRQDKQNGDAFGRGAHALYLSARAAMDAGAQVSNARRFDPKVLPDGTRSEESSLQAAMNLIADQGKDNFLSEYQNAPIEDDAEGTGLSERLVQNRAAGCDKGVVPSVCEALTLGVDIGGRQLHWCLVAWRAGMIGQIVDYGSHTVNSPLTGKLTSEHNRAAVESAVQTALLELADAVRTGWPQEGAPLPRTLDLALVDAGWQDKAVYGFCAGQSGLWRPCKGFGSGQRLAYRPPSRQAKDRLVGNNWAAMYQHGDRTWLYHVNSDFWKLSVQNGFLLPPDKPGSLTLWGQDPFVHQTYARHICAERWVREFVPGKGTREYFAVESKQNHWLDATHYAAAAASVLGLRVLEVERKAVQKVSFAEKQRQKRER
jgi:hypothetical protein